jgi:hypothetical protein
MKNETVGRLEGEIPRHLRGRPLFSEDATYSLIEERIEDGATLVTLTISEGQSLDDLELKYEGFLPLFHKRGDVLHPVSADTLSLQAGDTLVALVSDDV